MFKMLGQDLRRKAQWMYGSDRWRSMVKVLFAGGTMAMILYRLMQWAHRCRLAPLELIFNRLNAVCCQCLIGRGAEFGPGLVLLYGNGIVINGKVRGGSNVTLYHQVTIGGQGDRVPILGDNVMLGAGAKVIGPVRIGDGARVAVNSVVFRSDVPPNTTVMGIPAQPVQFSKARPTGADGCAPGTDPASPVIPCTTPRIPDPADEIAGSDPDGLRSCGSSSGVAM